MALSPDPRQCGSLSPEGILREIQINLLECKVCFEKFCTQERGRRPQNLPCGHVLCLECVTALSHPLLRKLECPFCRQLCGVESTSHCQVLSDLQDLLLSQGPTSSAPPQMENGGFSLTSALTSTALHLSTAFGGWGTLINPTGIALLRSSGTIVVVHDDEKRVVVFSPKGNKLHGFGRRGPAIGQICYPVDVAVALCGHVVVTDVGDKTVKVFTSRGNHVLTVKDFQMPWGVDTDSCGHILVSDIQAHSLSHVKVDYTHGVILDHHTAISDLQLPKALACCPVTGNIAVIEHLTDDTHPPERHQRTRLKVFTKEFHLIHQMDSFSLTMQSTGRLYMSGVAFDEDGNVIVIDSEKGMIWSLGKLHNGPVLTVLVGDHLVRPVGLTSLNNMLIVLDGGDHAVKIYSAKSDTAPKR
ncbi:E3 ubiquitin-protein ligase NHLRC1 [Echeneis naucrates]|uniref:RING-type E3 ubiquitin transferase n=1 Tax=Echeneis naucrates TaxID=173247 RepID=A0A665VDC0_ECHNA|nr:E3 ubiquitin-protein ligase NHLRC1 [Echeneis naucrates]